MSSKCFADSVTTECLSMDILSHVITGHRDRMSDLKVGCGTISHLFHSQQPATCHKEPPFTSHSDRHKLLYDHIRLQRPSIPLHQACFNLNRAHRHSCTQSIIYKVIVLNKNIILCVQIHRHKETHEWKHSAIEGFCSSTGWQHVIHFTAVRYAYFFSHHWKNNSSVSLSVSLQRLLHISCNTRMRDNSYNLIIIIDSFFAKLNISIF